MCYQIKKYSWLLGIICGLLSCQSKPESKSGQGYQEGKTISYRNAENGLAQIELDLLPDHRMRFFMETIPQPGTEERSEFMTSKGVWERRDSAFILIFQHQNLILEALFDESYDSDNTFTVVNDSTVTIPANTDKVWIWGVLCERK